MQIVWAGIAGRSAPIVRSLAQHPEVRQRLWRDFHTRRNQRTRLARIPELRLVFVVCFGRDWQRATSQSGYSVFLT